MTARPDVSIIVVSYNTVELTLACLRSLADAAGDVRREVIVVDNASDDGSAERIAAEHPGVRLAALPENLGFGAANNLAAAACSGRHFLLLNPDTVVTDDAVRRLVEFADAHPGRGIYGGRTWHASGALNASSCWRCPTTWSLFCRAAGLASLFPGSRAFDRERYDERRLAAGGEVDLVSGCFLLIERSLWRRLDGFDPVFFMYGEDADLCLRARALGARPTLCPAANIVHHGGRSERVRADKIVRLLQGRLRLLRRHWTPRRHRVARAAHAAWILRRRLAWSLLAALRVRGAAEAAAVFRNVWARRRDWLDVAEPPPHAAAPVTAGRQEPPAAPADLPAPEIVMHDPTAPIIVTGPSRSGTALMRACLNRHPDIRLAGETHYFDDLRVRLPARARQRLDESERRRCEDYFLALAHRPYGHDGDAERSPLARRTLRERAAAIGEGADACFEAFCRLPAEAEGAPRWGEKTPRHVFRIDDILRHYPHAQVLCMVRDPRAVVNSYRSWRNQGGFDFEADPGHRDALEREARRSSRSYHAAVIALLWRAAVTAAARARARHGDARVRLVRYEDLVRDPRDTLGSICAWLDVMPHDEMLDVPMQNSSFSRFQQQRGITDEALERWRARLAPTEIAIVQRCCGSLMRRFGYAPEPQHASALALARQWAAIPIACARAITENRHRMGDVPAYLWRRARLALART